MKYVFIFCCALVACSKQVQPISTQQDVAKQIANGPSDAIPSDVVDAVAILLGDRPYSDPTAVAAAANKVHSFETSVVVNELTLQNKETGGVSKQVTHRFRKLGLDITYLDGRVLGASKTANE